VQSIKKVAQLGWQPLFIINSTGSQTGTVMIPAGLENTQNIVSAAYVKDPTDPQWKDDAGIKNFDAFRMKYFPEGDRQDQNLVFGYSVAQAMVYVLKKCGDDLTRANIMKQAANIEGLQLEGLLPGIIINTSATDFAPVKQFHLKKFKGERWELFGDLINGEVEE
jgi:Periplasmic binding protein